MNRQIMTRKLILLAFALTATASLIAGCSRHSDDHSHLDDLDATSSMSLSPPSLTYPQELDVDARDAESVATTAVRTMYSWRFDTDTDGTAAVRRATPLLNATLAEQFAAIPPQPFVNYRLWGDWAAADARATVTAALSAEEHPDDTPTQWHRKVATQIDVTAKNGTALHTWSFAVLLTMQKQAGQWLVAQFDPLGV